MILTGLYSCYSHFAFKIRCIWERCEAGETIREENNYKEFKDKYSGRNVNKQENNMLLLYLGKNTTEFQIRP